MSASLLQALHRQKLLKASFSVAILSTLVGTATGTCEDVWFVEGKFYGETFTCGERIVHLQTPEGGAFSEQDARVKTALEDDKCADCWPWEKYREDGEIERSSKRGVAIENHRLTAESLTGLAKVVTWGMTWAYQTQNGPSLDVWDMAGVDFVPLVWGHETISEIQEDGLQEGRTALLGFNEPNFPNQADLTPQERGRAREVGVSSIGQLGHSSSRRTGFASKSKKGNDHADVFAKVEACCLHLITHSHLVPCAVITFQCAQEREREREKPKLSGLGSGGLLATA